MSTPAPVRPFVIINPAGHYYAGVSFGAEGVEADFSANLSAAFVYTWESAWRRIHKTPALAGCVAIELPAPAVL
jgi:hypothetical protein